jgi:hypothetical protein
VSPRSLWHTVDGGGILILFRAERMPCIGADVSFRTSIGIYCLLYAVSGA